MSRPPSARTRKPSIRRAVGIAVAAGLVLSACAPLGPTDAQIGEARTTDDRPVRDGGTLTVALASDPDRLDPSLSSTLVGRTVFASMCEKLYDVNEQLDVVPQLAAGEPRLSEDRMTLTIPIRKGITFSDGTPMDAEAVKTSLDRHLTLDASARRTELETVESVEVVDDQTVALRLSQPDAALPTVLADRAGMIMSPRALEREGEDFGNNPVCVGPFKFVERVAGNRIVLERNPEYYDADVVHLDRVVYRTITDGSIRLANLRSHDIQVGDQMAPIDVQGITGDDTLNLFNSGSLGYQGITLNVGNQSGVGEPVGEVDTPWAQDVRVRRAFSLALDRELITEIVFQGMHEPACGPIAPGTELADPRAGECPGRDLDRARRLLREAGVETPVPVRLTVTNTPEGSRLGQVIQAMAEQAGFDVELLPTEFATAIERSAAGDFESFQVGWSGRLDADGNIASFVGTGGTNNYAGYSNAKVDDLIARGRATTDTAERRDIYRQLNAITARELPIVYLYRQRNLVVTSQDVAGVKVFRDGLVRVKEAGYVE